MPLLAASRLFLAVALLVGLNACSIKTHNFPDEDYGPDSPVDVSHIPDAVPQQVPRSKYGNPGSYTVLGKTYYVLKDASDYRQRGLASWYGNKFHGRRTSSGERYDMYAMTAAHKTLPLPTWVRVTNLDNDKSVVVKVNDRGPFHAGRIIDLSYTAASRLGVLAKGTARVEVVVISPHQNPDNKPLSRQTNTETPAFPLWVQVGAFSNRQRARQELKRLQQLSGFGGRLMPVAHTQAPVYRVWLGMIKNPEDLQQLVDKLPDWGISSHRLLEAGNQE